MEYFNMDVDMCEPDSTVEINDSTREPPQPSQLDILRRQLALNRAYCAEIVVACMIDRGQVRQQVEALKERREVILNGLRVAEERRKLSIHAQQMAKAKIANIKERLDTELKFQPIAMTDAAVQDLTDRVAALRGLLQSARQSPEGRIDEDDEPATPGP